MVCDGTQQYIAFYEKLWNLLTKEKDGMLGAFFYTDFFGMFAYYMASPFTLLILLLRIFMNINEAVSIVVLIKIGCCGSAFTWYLRKRSCLTWPFAIALGCMYALSDYVLGYYNNLMWLDAVILLPFLAYSIEEFVYCQKERPYMVLLLLGIVANYYMGYMLGVFCILYFLSLSMKERCDKNDYIRFLICTTKCIGIAMCWLIPVAVSLSKTTAGNSLNSGNGRLIQGSMLKLLSRLRMSSVPVITSSDQGKANLFCGSMVLLFVVLYCINRHIHRREKGILIFLCLFYVAGYLFRPLNMFLHGFHKPIGIPNRFTFILIFIMLLIVSKELECIQWSVFRRKGRKALAFLLVADVCGHTFYGIGTMKLVNRDYYLERCASIKELAKPIDQTQCRVVLASQAVRNEELMNNLSGLSLFSSTIPFEVLINMAKLGANVRKNSVQYTGTSELVDLIFGVKYIIAQPQSMMYRSAYKAVGMQGEFIMFENDRAMKAGNELEKMIMNREWKGKNPFVIHESILDYAGSTPLYDFDTVKGEKTESDEWKTFYKVHVKKGNHTYLYLPGKKAEKVRINNLVFRQKYQNTSFLDLGYAKEDTTIYVLSTGEYDSDAVIGSYPEERLDMIAMDLKMRYEGGDVKNC